VVRLSHNTKDYYEDRFAAKELAIKIQDYYHQRGYDHVKVWLEEELQSSGRKFWNIRSNIVFKTP
jgi:hypothetical protein